MVVGERLGREVAVLAGRLAQFLTGSLPDADGAVADGQSFLWATFEHYSGGQPLASFEGSAIDRRPEGDPHPLDLLAGALALSSMEVDLLLLAGMPEEHEGFAAVLRTLHPRAEARASVGLAAQLLSNEPEERLRLRQLLESGVLVTSGALHLSGDRPFFERSLVLAESLWSALHGVDAWPASIQRIKTSIWMSGLHEWLASLHVARAVEAIARRETCTVLVTADNEEMAFHRAMAMVQHAGREPAGIALPAASETEMTKLIETHALARGVVPVLRLLMPDGPATPVVPSFSERSGAIVVCARSGAASVSGNRPLVVVSAERLSPDARRQMWSEALPELADQASFIAARYPVEPVTAAEVAADLGLLKSLDGREPTVKDVAAGIRARGALNLTGGVKLLRPAATFNDLVLSADRLAQLREAIERLMSQARVFDEWGFLRNRAGARGVRMLFTGPPGTGKTLSAEVLAGALAVDLLVVDLSRVVSKWIGETEKNLSAVFDTAERAQAVLFFDEADALFGKRTEVSDAHDRYANLETAYLLTRLENFEGLAVLATNLRRNIDQAFLRRLEFVVDFEEPDREERHALWRCHLPKDVPLGEDVNLYELAALYPVVGGVIRNAAVAAGFLAATDGTAIIREHFIYALRREYEKAGRAFPGVPAGMSVS